MKTYKLYFILLSVLTLASCNKEMTKGLEDVSVSVTPGENITVEGLVVTVKRGQPVEFNIAGAPDFVTFYSGELGHQYAFRDRYESRIEDIVSSKFKFNIYVGSKTDNNTIDVFYAYTDEENGVEGFPGLSKTDFDADSTLVDDFYLNNKWKRLNDNDKDEYKGLGTNVVNSKPIEFDVKNYIGKNLVIAIAYNADRQTNVDGTVQPKYFFDSMCIENELRNDTTTIQYAGNFMFTALNFNHDYFYVKSIKSDDNPDGNDWTSVSNYLPDNLAYGTVTANVPGLWNMSSVASGNFYIHSTARDYEWKTAWLVSDPINILACEPDQGESIKNLSQDVTSYTYTYNKPGTYKATFVFNNVNYKHDDNKIINVVINVN